MQDYEYPPSCHKQQQAEYTRTLVGAGRDYPHTFRERDRNKPGIPMESVTYWTIKRGLLGRYIVALLNVDKLSLPNIQVFREFTLFLISMDILDMLTMLP